MSRKIDPGRGILRRVPRGSEIRRAYDALEDEFSSAADACDPPAC
jgi:hypothetical protein